MRVEWPTPVVPMYDILDPEYYDYDPDLTGEYRPFDRVSTYFYNVAQWNYEYTYEQMLELARQDEETPTGDTVSARRTPVSPGSGDGGGDEAAPAGKWRRRHVGEWGLPEEGVIGEPETVYGPWQQDAHYCRWFTERPDAVDPDMQGSYYAPFGFAQFDEWPDTDDLSAGATSTYQGVGRAFTSNTGHASVQFYSAEPGGYSGYIAEASRCMWHHARLTRNPQSDVTDGILWTEVNPILGSRNCATGPHVKHIGSNAQWHPGVTTEAFNHFIHVVILQTRTEFRYYTSRDHRMPPYATPGYWKQEAFDAYSEFTEGLYYPAYPTGPLGTPYGIDWDDYVDHPEAHLPGPEEGVYGRWKGGVDGDDGEGLSGMKAQLTELRYYTGASARGSMAHDEPLWYFVDAITHDYVDYFDGDGLHWEGDIIADLPRDYDQRDLNLSDPGGYWAGPGAVLPNGPPNYYEDELDIDLLFGENAIDPGDVRNLRISYTPVKALEDEQVFSLPPMNVDDIDLHQAGGDSFNMTWHTVVNMTARWLSTPYRYKYYVDPQTAEGEPVESRRRFT